MAWTLYKSTDGSAPTLNGQAGSLLTVLDAILVNGYGAQPAAGWSIKFTNTNKRVYRMGAASPSRADYMIMDADWGGGSTTKEALITPWENASGTTGNNGTGDGQGTNSAIRKSNTADATARGWYCVADDRTCIFYATTGDTAGISFGHYFGEFYSYVPGDHYGTCCIGRFGNNSTYAGQNLGLFNHDGGTAGTGCYVPRNHLGFRPEFQAAVRGPLFCPTGSIPGVLAFPSPVDGAAWLSRHYLQQTAYGLLGIRGHLRGFWHPMHPGGSFNEGDTFSGTGALAGKSFIVFGTVNGASSSGGAIALETSNTVEYNS